MEGWHRIQSQNMMAFVRFQQEGAAQGQVRYTATTTNGLFYGDGLDQMF
jgi:hypothetical protein